MKAGFNSLADNEVCCNDHGSAFCGYVTAAQLTGPAQLVCALNLQIYSNTSLES